MNDQWRARITIEPGKRGGRPCIRGMRITVYDVLSYLAAGMTAEEILDDFPYLTAEDIQACLAFAAERERSMLVTVPCSSSGIKTCCWSSSAAWRTYSLGRFTFNRWAWIAPPTIRFGSTHGTTALPSSARMPIIIT